MSISYECALASPLGVVEIIIPLEVKKKRCQKTAKWGAQFRAKCPRDTLRIEGCLSSTRVQNCLRGKTFFRPFPVGNLPLNEFTISNDPPIACVLAVTINNYIAIPRSKLRTVTDPTGSLSPYERRSGSQKTIIHNVTGKAAVLNDPDNELDWRCVRALIHEYGFSPEDKEKKLFETKCNPIGEWPMAEAAQDPPSGRTSPVNSR